MTAALDLAGLRAATRESPLAATLRAQIEELARKDSSNGKPYYELRLRDATGGLTLRAWSDTPAFHACMALAGGAAVEVEGEFFLNGSFGMDARRWTLRALSVEEAMVLYGGADGGAIAGAMQEVAGVIETLRDPRLQGLCKAFLGDFGSRFQRAAAARANHHARRGGLLLHTAQMLRTAAALCTVYPHLNRDLLLAGTLFHDAGKLWETCPPEAGFDIPRELRGELLGHITIGIELANSLWRTLPLDHWKGLEPSSELVRLHLLHLIASHHGQLDFGSPVEPKTPEACALHYLDNLDAKLEMFAEAAGSLPEVAPGILERLRPLNIHPVVPLPVVSE
jgi:3'-5' exoribonuclease